MEDLGKVSERFWAKVGGRPDHPDSCWPWIGGANKDGRGRFGFRGRVELAYRVAFILAHGDIPRGLDVLHDCDNPRCVRPSHLFLGTALDNVADMHAKGRGGRPGAKLSREAVLAIRVGRPRTQSEREVYAERFGTTPQYVGMIVAGRRGKSVA